MPYGISINPEDDFNDKIDLSAQYYSSRLDMLARDLVVYGKLIREQFLNDLRQNSLVITLLDTIDSKRLIKRNGMIIKAAFL